MAGDVSLIDIQAAFPGARLASAPSPTPPGAAVPADILKDFPSARIDPNAPQSSSLTGTGSVMGNDTALQQALRFASGQGKDAMRGFVKGIPLAARVAGGMAGTALAPLNPASGPLASEAAGQLGDLTAEALTGGVQHKSVLERGGQAALNVATQVPLGMRAPGFTPQLEEGLAKGPAAAGAQPSLPMRVAGAPQAGLENVAGNQAIRVSALRQHDAQVILGRAGGTEAAGLEMIRQGIVGSARDLTFTVGRSATKADQQVASIGSALNAKYSSLDKVSPFVSPEYAQNMQPSALLQRLRAEVLAPLADSPAAAKAVMAVDARLTQWADIWAKENPGKPLTLQQLWKFRQDVDPSKAQWNAFHAGNDPSESTLLFVKLRNAIQNETLNAANDLARQSGKGALGDDIKELNRQYSVAAMASDLFSKGEARRFVKPSVGYMDVVAGGVGAAGGQMYGFPGEGAAAAVLAKKALDASGHHMAAAGAYWAAKTAGLAPAAMSALSDYKQFALQQTGRELLPHEIPARVWQTIQSIQRLDDMKGDKPDEPATKAVGLVQERLRKSIVPQSKKE